MALLTAQGNDFMSPPNCMWSILSPPATMPECKPYGCIGSSNPTFLNNPSRTDQAAFFFFALNSFGFGLNPFMIQRAYIAPSDSTLKFVIMVLCVAPFLTFLPGVHAGLIKAAFGASWSATSQQASAFSAVTLELMQKSTFEYLLMSALSCAALAAIMSTADSLILGATNVLSVDVYNKWVAPNASQEHLVRFGGCVCFCLLALGVLTGTFLEPDQFGTLLILQNGLLLQMAPAFVCGLFYDVSAKALIAGIIAGCSTVAVGTIIGQPFFTYLDVTGAGVALNILTCMIGQMFVCCGGKEVDGEQGETHLTQDLIQQLIEPVQEPNKMCLAASFLLAMLSIPFYDEPGQKSILVAGIPAWAIRSLVLQVAATAALLFTAWTWRTEQTTIHEAIEDPSTSL